jgi:hypothetical protein
MGSGLGWLALQQADKHPERSKQDNNRGYDFHDLTFGRHTLSLHLKGGYISLLDKDGQVWGVAG